MKWLIEALSRNIPVMFEEEHETSNLGQLMKYLISEVGISLTPDLNINLTPNLRSSLFLSIKLSVIFVAN
jgi:hypothetical protein